MYYIVFLAEKQIAFNLFLLIQAVNNHQTFNVGHLRFNDI